MKKRMWNGKRGSVTNVLKKIWIAAIPALCLVMAGAISALAEETSPEESSVIISTDYPGVSAKPGASVSFPLYIVNSSRTEEDALLSAKDLPDGWSGYFRGTDSEVSSIHIRANQKKEDSPKLSYSVTVPDDAADGDYTFTVQAAGDNGQAETKMTITVTSQEAGQSDRN